MHRRFLPPLPLLPMLGVALVALLPGAAMSQAEGRSFRFGPGRMFDFFSDDETRAVIGISTSNGSARDTLGVLVSSVHAGGPAEKAGIEEGNRIASISGAWSVPKLQNR